MTALDDELLHLHLNKLKLLLWIGGGRGLDGGVNCVVGIDWNGIGGDDGLGGALLGGDNCGGALCLMMGGRCVCSRLSAEPLNSTVPLTIVITD